MKNKFILFLLLSLSVILVGCSGFFEEEVLSIESIVSENLEDGSTLITIYYTDEDTAPVEFVVPPGKAGQTGNGIKEIKVDKDSNNYTTHLEIIYTDPALESTKVDLVDGKSVTGIETVIDSNDNTKKSIIVLFSDGTKSDPIPLERGVDGATYVGVRVEINEDDLSQKAFFQFKQGDEIVEAEIDIPAPQKGEAGRGIAKIETIPSDDGSGYDITVYYSDQSFEGFFIPRGNKWFTQLGTPDSSLGIVGDMYFDATQGEQKIYLKESTGWKLVVQLGESKQYVITFDLNDKPEGNAKLDRTSMTLYGESFAQTGDEIPIPTREGYIFKGWYSDKVIKPTSGKLDYFTVLVCDIKVYAIWEVDPAA